GVEANADLAFDTTDALDAADAADALQLAHNHVFHEPRQLLGSLARRDRRVGDNWKPGNVHALDQGLVNGARQIGTHARNRILNVVERAIAVGLQTEEDNRACKAVGDRGLNMLRPLHAADGVLDLLGNLRFKLGRRCAELSNGDRNRGCVDVRQPCDRDLLKPNAPDPDDRSSHNDGWKRLPNRPCRNIKCHAHLTPVATTRRSNVNNTLSRNRAAIHGSYFNRHEGASIRGLTQPAFLAG